MPITIDSTDAAVAAAPYLIGFTPQDSLVLLFLGEDQELLVSMRIDLPEGADLCWLRSVLNGIPHPTPSAVLMIAYADEYPDPYAQAAALWVLHTFAPAVDVVDVVLVADGHFCSLYDDSGDEQRALMGLRDHPVVAACVAAGLSALGTRDDLVSYLEGADDEVSAAVREILDTAVPRRPDRDALERQALDTLCTDGNLRAEDVVCISRACADVHVRDPLMALLLEPRERTRQVQLNRVRTRLAYCVTHLPDPQSGAVAATLALLSWADGDGAAGLVAAQRAQQSDPRNTLAPLVEQALSHGLPPDTWSSLTADIPLDVLRGGLRRSA
jgi:hypothetical protein